MNIRFISMFLLSIGLNTSCIAQESNLRLSISLESPHFISDQDRVFFSIINDSNNAILVPLLYACRGVFLEVHVYSESGNEIPSKKMECRYALQAEHYLEMQPMSAYTFAVDLREEYELRAGEYTISATYETLGYAHNDLQVWTGRMASNAVKVFWVD